MEVQVVSSTLFPIFTIGNAAGTSTGKGKPNSSTDKQLMNRITRCYEQGHMSVFEFADLDFYISGISRACSHQLVRHRHMSFVQQSQRYNKIYVNKDDWYVMPKMIKDDTMFIQHMRTCAAAYVNALANGVRPEDARFLLPEACKTDISVKTNLRSFFQFLDLREDMNAQWEIRDLAHSMEQAAIDINDQWKFLINLRRKHET